jgi:transcriptional regulator with XRE-family HTH domain
LGDVTRERLIARRRALGFTQSSLAYRIECERTTVARWERGESEVSPHLRGPLADALEWTLPQLDQALSGSRMPRPEHGWWSNYEALEQSAVSIRTWEPMVVPGLLQTRAYAAALLGGADDLVERRMDRQRLVNRPESAVSLVALVDESVLHRTLGSPAVLAAQLYHLAAMARQDNITIRVLAQHACAQAVTIGCLGAFVILGAPWPGGLVYLEHQGGARSLDSPHEIEAHAEAFTRLRDAALPPAESAALILTAASEMERR